MRLKRAEATNQLTTKDYAQLAALRQAVRLFVRFSEDAAEQAGLTAQQYQAMLVLRACADAQPVSINDLAVQLLIKHNSAVGLVDRLEADRLVARTTSQSDRRKVELHLTPHGRHVLAKLAVMHRRELQRIGPVVQRFFAELATSTPSQERVNGAAKRTPPRG